MSEHLRHQRTGEGVADQAGGENGYEQPERAPAALEHQQRQHGPGRHVDGRDFAVVGDARHVAVIAVQRPRQHGQRQGREQPVERRRPVLRRIFAGRIPEESQRQQQTQVDRPLHERQKDAAERRVERDDRQYCAAQVGQRAREAAQRAHRPRRKLFFAHGERPPVRDDL